VKNRLIASGVLALFACGWSFGQQPAPQSGESHKYRTIFTLAGGGGGFAVGLVVGLSAFDDAVNSDRKVWTTAALSAVGGAVGGYFLGRALDKRQKKPKVTWRSSEPEPASMRAQRSALRAYDRSSSWPRAGLPNFGDHFLTGRKLGTDQANRHATANWDLSYLYLASQLRRIEDGRLTSR
jgi:hypothetical protein